MKQLSLWASQHKWTARLLVVACYVLANLLGDAWAVWMYAEAMKPASALVWTTVLLTIAALLLHPGHGKHKATYYSYPLRKYCDLFICIATVVLIAFTTLGRLQPVESAQASIKWQPAQHPTSERTSEGSRVVSFFHRAARRYTELALGWKIALVVLAIAATVVLGYFWLALCCSIACNGMEALAIILLILGWGGLVVGCIFLCRRIIGRPRFKGPRLKK